VLGLPHCLGFPLPPAAASAGADGAAHCRCRFALLLASTVLRQLITSHWNNFDAAQQITIRDYLLQYLAERARGLPHFVVRCGVDIPIASKMPAPVAAGARGGEGEGPQFVFASVVSNNKHPLPKAEGGFWDSSIEKLRPVGFHDPQPFSLPIPTN